MYGLLYVFSRNHEAELEKNRKGGLRKELEKSGNEGLLSTSTKRVNLYVVAPEKFYEATDGRRYGMSWFESELDTGLVKFLKTDYPKLDLLMHFRFEKLPNKFLQEDHDSGHGLILGFKPTPVYS